MHSYELETHGALSHERCARRADDARAERLARGTHAPRPHTRRRRALALLSRARAGYARAGA